MTTNRQSPAQSLAAPDADGIVSALPNGRSKTFSQRFLDTRMTAWGYDRIRDRLLRVAGMPDFATEVAAIAANLHPQPGDAVLDLACGHGNFTVEWARLVGPDGVVIGLDYSRSMLRRAAARVRETGLTNVILVHGDAHHLPFGDSMFDRVNCSGGFHAFPDLPRALREIARVARPDAHLTASTFAYASGDRFAGARQLAQSALGLHFVPLDLLGDQLHAAGFDNYKWTKRGGAFAYCSAELTA